MEVKINECFGCIIINRNGKYFIQYDSGGSASWIVENEILPREVEKAQISAESAYEVIIESQKRGDPKRV